MAYAITITTKPTVAGVSAAFPLGAAITGMTIGDNCTVHWVNDKGLTFNNNDLPVLPLVDDGTSGINSGTEMVAAGTGQAIKFTAKLMLNGNAVATSTAVSVTFQQLNDGFKFITDKIFAPSVESGSLTTANLIKAVVIVTDNTGNPVEGAEVQWITQPGVSTLSVYQDTSGTVALTDGGVPYSLSAATTGQATAYFADEKTHEYLLIPQVLGSDASLQTTVYFAGTIGESVQYGSLLIPHIESDNYGHEYLNIISTQTSFSAQPRGDVRRKSQDDFFYVLMNQNIVASTTVGQLPADISLSYAALKPPLTEITQNVPPANMNELVFFIQDSVNGNVGMSAPVKFYGLGEWAGNVPDKTPTAPAGKRILSQAQVVPTPVSGIITTDTINKYMELRVYIPPLSSAYTGKTAQVLFYLNGYYKDDHTSQLSGQERHGNPTVPVQISSSGTKVTLPYSLIFGYALGPQPQQQMGISYIDYYIDMGGNQFDYSIYPIAYGTDTDYP